MIGSIGSALSGLHVGTASMAVAAGNVANISTPGYQQRSPVVAERLGGGAAVTGIQAGGAVSVAEQMVQMLTANATVKANVATIKWVSDAYQAVIDM